MILERRSTRLLDDARARSSRTTAAPFARTASAPRSARPRTATRGREFSPLGPAMLAALAGVVGVGVRAMRTRAERRAEEARTSRRGA